MKADAVTIAIAALLNFVGSLVFLASAVWLAREVRDLSAGRSRQRREQSSMQIRPRFPADRR